MSSPMARGSLEISPITSTNVSRRRPTFASSLCRISYAMGRSSGKQSRLDVENERGSELMADLCVSMMHGAT